MAGSEELIERSEELGSIDAALEAARRCDGGVLWLRGTAGIGKTSLLREAGRMGAPRGFQAFQATGLELESGFPFGVVRQLYERTVKEAAPVDQGAMAPSVAAIFGAPAPASAGDPSFQALHGLYWLVAELAERQPLLIAVDDAQWADFPSLRHLLYLARRLEGLPVLLVVAERTGEAPAPVLEELRQTASVRIEPRPLSLSGVQRLVASTFGEDASAEFAAACRERTGGLPLYLGETLRALREESASLDASSIDAVLRASGEGLESHVWRRIESVDPEATAVVAAIAVLGERASPGRIAALGDIVPPRATSIVAGLCARGILAGEDVPRFTHPVVRGAVEARIYPDAMHWSAARLLDREGSDIDDIAGHLLACAPRDDPWAVGCLREFAATALRRGAPELAARALRRALEEPPPEVERAFLLCELAGAEDAAGRPEQALAHLVEAARRTSATDEQAAIAVSRAEILASVNRFAEAVAVLDEALERFGDADHLLTQRIDAELISYAVLFPGARARGLERLATYAGNVPEGPATQPVLTAMAYGVALSGEGLAAGAALAERALQAESSGGRFEAYSWLLAALVLNFCDRPDLAAAVADEQRAQTWREGHAGKIFAVELVSAFSTWRMGELPTAVSGARAALAIGPPGAHLAWAHGTLAMALVDSGELEAAEAALAAADPGHWLEEAVGSFMLYGARTQLRLEQGRLAEAAADLAELRRRSEESDHGLRTPNDLGRPSEVLVAHRRGDAAEARRLAAAELETARRFEVPGYLGLMLRLSGMAAAPEDRLGFLRESVAQLRDSVFRLEYARSLIELGAELRRRGERVKAREPLAEGLDLAYRCGASRVVSQAMEELRAAGARPRRAVREGPDALSAAESRMAVLAACGRSNREIAQELCVTLKTVESTLMRAYAKLGISGRGARAALPEALGPLYRGSSRKVQGSPL
ncbi:MAG TPA: AAA family ATPase [Devosiaceae bacterium]|nr:AAA family ATPase [Devosiaceae bacterium]